MLLTRRALLKGTGSLLAAASLPAVAEPLQQLRFRIEALPLLSGCDYSEVSGINNRGHSVGLCSVGQLPSPNGRSDSRAVLWKNGKAVDLVGKQFPSARAARINDQDQILLRGPYEGRTTSEHIPEYRVLWNGKIKQVWHEADGFLPDVINNKGMIVGVGDAPFLVADGEMINLNSLLPEDSGWTLQTATGINDRVQIVGNGELNRQRRAFLMTAV